jgi:hypothetical protein
MPRLSVYCLRMALIYLALGFTFGALMLWNKGLPISPFLWLLLPAHLEFLLLGWTLLLIFGVAFWILPRFHTARRREGWVWAAFGLLNLGLWLVALSPFLPLAPMQIAGRIAEAAAVMAFAFHAWPRIKPPAF